MLHCLNTLARNDQDLTTSAASDLDQRLAFARRWAESSPFYEQLGIAVESLDEGAARVRMQAAGDHLNADGIVHGGVLPALADAAMGCALRTVHGASAQLLTVESNTRYVRPAGPGVLTADGRVIQAHRNIAFVEAEISDDAGRLLARAGATFLLKFPESTNP